MKKFALLPFTTLLLLLLISADARAEGKLDVVGKFTAEGAEFNVDTYIQDTDKVGLIGIHGEKRLSVAFAPNEWDSLINLYQKSVEMQSATWQFVGSFKETDSTPRTLLLVAAGPGVQFIIVDPKGTISFVLTKNDFGRFEANVRQVKEFFAH